MKKIQVAFILILILMAGCAKKPPAPPVPTGPEYELKDLREIPQDLQVFAKEYGSSKRVISAARQDELARAFVETWAGPWHMGKTSISRRDMAGLIGGARGYRSNSIPWSKEDMEAMRKNAAIRAFPSRRMAGITVRATDLRSVPTHEPRFKNPTPDPAADPFDYFQYSLLPIGTPLFIAHVSLDRQWYYVECPIAGGWVDARDVAIADKKFQQEWLTGNYAALIAENVNLPGTGPQGGDSTGGIGTLLPLIRETAQNIHVLVPVMERNGHAGTAEISLSKTAAARQPMPMTAGNVATVGNAMLGQKYGWGGMLGLRDCSAMIRDIFTPFGIWLPRNSRAQARRGDVIFLERMSGKEKEQAIMAKGVPFLSLVGMPGHITLYVGNWHNQPCLFHNVWGVRIVKDGNDDERFVIGRAVITSIRPGSELDNLYRLITFEDRIKTVTTTKNAD